MKINSSELSKVINQSTNEIITNTENFIKKVKTENLGKDTVTIMINGSKSNVNQDDYIKLKEQNSISKLELKKNIKSLVKPYKENLKSNLEKSNNNKNSKKKLTVKKQKNKWNFIKLIRNKFEKK